MLLWTEGDRRAKRKSYLLLTSGEKAGQGIQNRIWMHQKKSTLLSKGETMRQGIQLGLVSDFLFWSCSEFSFGLKEIEGQDMKRCGHGQKMDLVSVSAKRECLVTLCHPLLHPQLGAENEN